MKFVEAGGLTSKLDIGTHRVQVNVITQPHEVIAFVAVNYDRLVTSLEKVAAQTMGSVEARCVGDPLRVSFRISLIFSNWQSR